MFPMCVSAAGTLGGGGGGGGERDAVVKKQQQQQLSRYETSSTSSWLECTHSKMGRVMSSKTNNLLATVHVADTLL